jgi:hypothetical protein
MGLTPVSTNAMGNFTPKSFWQRPEGKPGKVVLGLFAAGAALALLVFTAPIVAFLTTAVQNIILLTVEGMIEAGLIILSVVLATNKTLHSLVKNIFQSSMRMIARTYTQVDPLGIMRNTLDDMKSERVQLGSTIQTFAGTDEKLQRTIKSKVH